MSARPPAGRLVALFAALAVGLAGVAVRLVTLQLKEGTRYRALAEEQRVRRIRLVPERGAILDRSMHELALSLPARAVYVDPRRVVDPENMARQLAPLLDVHQPQLLNLLRTDESFVYLARRVDLRVAQRIEALKLPGIGLLDESKRYYPGRSLAAQVLGFVGVDDTGLSGLELQYQDVLAGRPGSLLVEQDPSGQAIPQGSSEAVEPARGHDLVLTLDRDLQFHAERALEEAVERNGAKGGMVIAMVPRTGEILAMAGFPTFDANEFSEALPETTRNRSVTDAYEPGSVNKVITAAAALEEGAVGLHERWTVPDRYQVADKLFHDSHPHPPLRMTLTDVIAESSNVGTIMTAQRLGPETLDDYLRKFGFGQDTGIDFPGESDGILMPADDWWQTSMGTIPIGQGIAVTPLQMLSVYATIANGGVRVEPRLIRGALTPDGTFLGTQPSAVTRVISADTARLVTGMLGRAVETGTGQEAQIPGYWVAGKTGTARKPLEGQLGYSEQYVASFIGFAPARRPAVAVAAILDEPETVYGGVAAAPLFREVTHFALAHLRVPSADPPRSPPALVGE
ncbi:MAG TPA: penicillin-binding protein 2 [Actinomycetota bacterium]|nr:penicillin-binding protein 2 [Actinomycetota bacterium]